jgi:glyoxylate utilization-related uncharacterized protein
MSKLNQPTIIDFPKITDPRGNLTFLQNPDQIPFEIERVFWIYDVPGGEYRGGHANKTQQELIIALSGSFDIVVNDKLGNEQKFCLNRSYFGLYLPAGTWRHMENFSTNSVSMHVCSTDFDEQDYIRDFEMFKTLQDE